MHQSKPLKPFSAKLVKFNFRKSAFLDSISGLTLLINASAEKARRIYNLDFVALKLIKGPKAPRRLLTFSRNCFALSWHGLFVNVTNQKFSIVIGQHSYLLDSMSFQGQTCKPLKENFISAKLVDLKLKTKRLQSDETGH